MCTCTCVYTCLAHLIHVPALNTIAEVQPMYMCVCLQLSFSRYMCIISRDKLMEGTLGLIRDLVGGGDTKYGNYCHSMLWLLGVNEI